MTIHHNKIKILDTTLRDGEQTQGVSFTPSEKANIAKALLLTLGVDRIEVASARVSSGEKEAVANIIKWAKTQDLSEKIEVLGFVDFDKSVDWIFEAGGSVINLLVKGSEKHCHAQLKKTLAEHLEDIRKTILYAFSKGLKVNIYLEDWSNGYRDKKDYVFGMMEGLKDLDIEHVMLPDTLGVMMPEEVFSAISDMVTRYPERQFDFHAHNDYGLATANSMMAVKAGSGCIHCTINCLGERAGNASMAEVATVLQDKMGKTLSIDESHLVHLSRMVENFSGKPISSNTPIIGDDVFTQTSGIHADGDSKGELYQSDLKPERFGRRHSYALGKLSGKASLLKNMEELGLRLTPENQKKVLKRIVELGDSKNVITTEDLHFIIADVLESVAFSRVKLVNCSLTSGLELESTASIRLKIDHQYYLSSGSGNGGYDAFMNAMTKILLKQKTSMPKLEDFTIRIPKGGNTNALVECIITWGEQDKSYKTRGVHSNQVFAAVNATMKMLNMKFQSATQPKGNDETTENETAFFFPGTKKVVSNP
ncbi:MAG: 2-isopropylmalate synthase [Deltaproteobacteria bacterium]|nr:2-isopropylmalate synthase [Deltaproteobacteria bacterium]